MKKYYSTPEYKKRNTSKINRANKLWKKRRWIRYHVTIENERAKTASPQWDPEKAPKDFRLLVNPEGCLSFFRKVRDIDSAKIYRKQNITKIYLRHVKEIDYASVNILSAIADDLRLQKISLRGDLPACPICRDFMIGSGFLDNLFNLKTRQKYSDINKSKSGLFYFEKGSQKLSKSDNARIGNQIRNVVLHLTGESKPCHAIKTVLLEICGNSIEHSDSENRQWLLGVKYLNDKVVFAVTDLGHGILKTLHRKFTKKAFDVFKTDDQVLVGAFHQRYGSQTQELNRNKGLPSIREKFEQGLLKNLIVLTNNVYVDFQNKDASFTFNRGSARLHGTFFQWEIDKQCIDNANINRYAHN
jgi:hypothetical protein